MSRIAAAFDIQPPVHLIKEFSNNIASEASGKFNPANLNPTLDSNEYFNA